MEATLDRISSDTSTTEDFEIIVNNSTVLSQPVIEKSNSNLEDLITEALTDSSTVQKDLKKSKTSENNITSNAPEGLDLFQLIDECDGIRMEQTESPIKEDIICDDKESCRLVGAGSKFYNVIETVDTHPLQMSPVESLPTPTEKQDDMKPSESDDEVSDIQQNCTVFDGVSYLGAATISSPRSEPDIQRIMNTLSAQRESETGIAVSISIPICSDGLVVLYDAATNSVMARYSVKRISFYARGAVNTPVASCFAFTWSHGETREMAVYQCHVFRCHIAEAVSQVSSCFVKAFERVPPRSMTSSLIGGDMNRSVTSSVDGASLAGAPPPPMQLMHVLECMVEIKEIDHKGSYVHVPKERLGFKIRGGVDKQVNISVKQVRNNGESLEDAQDTYNGRLIIDRCFGILLAPGRNVKHSDMRLLEMVGGATDEWMGYNACAMWNAGDPALAGFNLVGENGPKFMSVGLDLVIRGIPDPLRLVVETHVKVYPPTEKFWYFSKRPLVQQFFVNLKETTDAQGNSQYVISGIESSGELDRSKLLLSFANFLPSYAPPPPPSPPSLPDSDNDEPLLSGTGEVSKDCSVDILEQWSQVLRSWNESRPKTLSQLVRLGIPEALRCEVWKRLSETDKYQDLIDQYRLLITKDCDCEDVIQRDIARTFPAHDFFKEAGGLGQDSLLRLFRAYAVYDTEIGYCQGLSFFAATLLLHMPEEEAFGVLVSLMYGYGLRYLYKDGFDHLYMRLHQLDRLMEEHLPDLRQHFRDMGVESHMYAAQWFLTLYTAKFPLPLAYHIMDVFLLQGMDTLFQVAIALLSKARKDLLLLDLEGILKYFRVTLPKRCRDKDVARKIVKHACTVKVKRLPKYQAEFEAFTKETTQKEINVKMDRLKGLNSQLLEEIEFLETRLTEAWEESKAALNESARNADLAQKYKEICARQDKQLHQMQDVIKDCLACSKKMSPTTDNKEDEPKWVKGDGDAETLMRKQVHDLEQELVQVKLELVEAECKNEELAHQLGVKMNDQALVNQKQSWPPWLAKTLGSLKEAAQNTRPSFQTYLPNLAGHDNSLTHLSDRTRDSDKSPTSPVELRRVSVPYAPNSPHKTVKRHSMDTSRKIEGTETNKENRRSECITSNLKQ